MVIFKSLKEIKKIQSSVLTLGVFDGIHKGHMEIISRVKLISKNKSIPSVIITFDPHPKNVLAEGEKIFYINNIKQKTNILNKIGIDYLFIIPFNKTLSNKNAFDFLLNFIIKPFNPKNIVIGPDHNFGKDREGDYPFLEKYKNEFKYEVEMICPKKNAGEKISSTSIRNFISTGNIKTANHMLGRNFSFEGKIVEGKKIGREIGFPTINIMPINDNQIIPSNGVYCVEVIIDNELLLAMCNIGYRPTFYKNSIKIIEAHIINYDKQDLYGETILVKFKNFIRKEKKYKDVSDLRYQLNNDKEECIRINNLN